VITDDDTAVYTSSKGAPGHVREMKGAVAELPSLLLTVRWRYARCDDPAEI
jgi:hypothetical protein